MRSRLSLRFWMADSDISLLIFRDTPNTMEPNMQKIRMMERSRGNPRGLSDLFGVFFIGSLHSDALERSARPSEMGIVSGLQSRLQVAVFLLYYFFPFSVNRRRAGKTPGCPGEELERMLISSHLPRGQGRRFPMSCMDRGFRRCA